MSEFTQNGLETKWVKKAFYRVPGNYPKRPWDEMSKESEVRGQTSEISKWQPGFYPKQPKAGMGKSAVVQGGKGNSAYRKEYLSSLLPAREPQKHQPQQQYFNAK